MRYYFYKSKAEKKKEHKYHRDFHEIHEVLEEHPKTWDSYKNDANGFISIIEMEMAELRKANSEHNYRHIIENLIHVAAACVKAHHEMTCDKPTH